MQKSSVRAAGKGKTLRMRQTSRGVWARPKIQTAKASGEYHEPGYEKLASTLTAIWSSSPSYGGTGRYTTANLLWYPVKNVTTGAELWWGERKNRSRAAGEDLRTQLTVRYRF